jgi:Mn-dependent DtxR family transcriptional regulator
MRLSRDERRILRYLKKEGSGDTEQIADLLTIPLRRMSEAIESLAAQDLVVMPDRTAVEISDEGYRFDIFRQDECIPEELKKMPKHVTWIYEYLHENQSTEILTIATLLELQDYQVNDAISILEEAGIPARDRIS